MSEPEFQGQHRISQVYLKHFGYQKDSKWFISVLEKGKSHTDNLEIENFTKEVNIFDIPIEDMEVRRRFENTNGLIESDYHKVINTIKNQKQLIPIHQDTLRHFVASMYCRSASRAELLELLLHSKDTKEKFLEEITMFSEEDPKLAKEFISIFKKKHQLNLVIGTLMNHLVTVFRSMDCVILKDYGDRGWLTTDNPVVLDERDNHAWLIPPEAEIYFPMTRDYLLFMYLENSPKKDNPLRKLKTNKIHQTNEKTHREIYDRIAFNNSKYLILPVEMEKYFLDKKAS